MVSTGDDPLRFSWRNLASVPHAASKRAVQSRSVLSRNSQQAQAGVLRPKCGFCISGRALCERDGVASDPRENSRFNFSSSGAQ